jgi:phage shock protein C
MVLLIFPDGIGLLFYLIAWIVIPREPYVAEAPEGEVKEEPEEKPKKVEYAPWNKYIPGAILIALGLFFILKENYWWWHVERFWPLLLVVFGVFLIFRMGQRHEKLEGTNESSQV